MLSSLKLNVFSFVRSYLKEITFNFTEDINVMIFDMTSVTSCELIHKDADLALYRTIYKPKPVFESFLALKQRVRAGMDISTRIE